METQPTIFPDLNSEEAENATFHVRRSPLDPGLVAQWRQADSVLWTHYIKAVWAILLRRYAGSGSPTFTVIQDLHGSPALRESEPSGTHRAEAQVETWEVSEDPNTCFMEAARRRRAEPWPGIQPDCPVAPCATGVRIQRDIHQDVSSSCDYAPIFDACSLLVTLDLRPSVVDISLRYSTAAISDKYAVAILETVTQLFESMLGGSHRKLSSVNFLGQHASRLLAQWNDPRLLARPQTCIHALILAQCQQQPTAEAVCAWDGSVSYAELDRLSGVLADRLVSLGVRSEIIVPVIFEKSMWTVVAIMGILRAGGVFALLDPSQPRARLLDICNTCEAKIIVASRSLQETAGELCETVVPTPLDKDGMEDLLSPLNPAPTPPGNPADAAYVAFTSGSTGKPKAIVIEHQSFCANALAQNEVQNLTRHSRAFQFASYGFDSSILEMLMTLIAGGCVCVPSEAQRVNELPATINKLRANWVELTPSVARMLTPATVPGIRSLLLVGEPLSLEHITTWSGKVQLINAYGPAECSVVATIQPAVRPSDPSNIGRSHSGHCWVVDPRDISTLQPLGAPGELLVSGPLVGRGYLNHPEQQAYVPAPPWAADFGLPPGERFYRTGDMAYYNLDDGTLRYLGRKDRQVKVHGQRIELSEIEHHAQLYAKGIVATADVVNPRGHVADAVLTLFVAQGGAEDGAVFAGQDGAGLLAPVDERTRAFWKEMRSWLRGRLPSYMVPTMFVPMNRFPLTATGKLDRRTLVTLASQALVSEEERHELPAQLPAACGVERVLRSLFSAVLGVPESRIAADDEFFALGGTSLRAIELVACARSRGIGITATDVINLQTPAALVQAASQCHDLPTIPPLSLISEQTRLSARKITSQFEDGGTIEDVYPCTPLQAGMMALSVKIMDAFVGTFAFTLPPQTDLTKFKRAWEQVIAANPILRTRIVQVESESLQVVVAANEVPWAGSFPTTNDSWPMGLGTPLLRVGLIDRGGRNQEPLFVMKIHHAIFDAWSYAQMLEDVQTVYQGSAPPKRQPLSNLVDYISRLDSRDAKRFWKTEFAGYEAVAFPPRLPSGTAASARRAPRSLSLHVHSTAIDQDWALASKVQLAWAIVISTHTSTRDVVFGLTVSGRTAPVQGIDRTMGPTIATVPFRVQLQTEQALQEALVEIHGHAMSLVPFEHTGLLSIGDSSADAAAACGFQNLLTVQLRTVEDQSRSLMTDAPGNEDEECKFNTYPLFVIVEAQTDARLQLKALFDGSVLHDDQVQIILERFAAVLERILHAPQDARIVDLTLPCPSDRQRLTAWNQRELEDRLEFVHRQVEDHAATHPESEAVCAWDGSLTYRELVRVARSVAAHLQAQGATPETVIGICTERSKWLPVAMLGVLLSGAAMVCLEPSFPIQRLQSICRDVETQLVVSTAMLRDKCSKIASHIVVLSDEAVTGFDADAYRPPVLSLQNLAYVAFTSGSTGAPKGATLEHSMLSLAVRAHVPLCGLTRRSRGLAFASLAFDICILEITFVLGAGGCLCIPSETQRTGELAETMEAMKVDWATLTPTVARTLSPPSVPTLETLVLIGESVSEADIATWGPHVALHNGYGPAECAMLTTTAVHLKPGHHAANVGFAPNASCWVVDPHNHDLLQPVGCVGELVVGGPIVARGYMNREAETAAAYIHSPAWASAFPFVAGCRFYKTGDLACHNPDGSLSIMGRKDSQVKLHGQRIELHEIEHQAEAYHSGATTCIALLVNFQHLDGARIVLFTCGAQDVDFNARPNAGDATTTSPFVPDPDRYLDEIQRLKGHLGQTLPHFMVPSMIIPLRYLPLTPSRKANRNQLREWAEAMSRAQLASLMLLCGDGKTQKKRQPASNSERLVHRAFATVLSIPEDTFGVDDSFFALGGDSISAMRLLGLCRAGGMSLTAYEFLTYNTAALFCEHAATLAPAKEQCDPVPVSNGPVDTTGGLRLSHDEWQGIYDLAGQTSVGSVQSVHRCSDAHSGMLELYTSQYRGNLTFALECADPISPHQVMDAWKAVVHRHTALRTLIIRHPNSHEVYLHVLLNSAPPTVVVLPPAVEDALGILKALPPTPWEKGAPPHRLVVGQDRSGQLLLRLETGCALIDAMSVPILLNDLALALRGQLPRDPATPYSEYLSYLQTQSKEQQTRDYWKRALAGARPCRLPRRPSAQPDGFDTDTSEHRSVRRSLGQDFDRLDAFWRSNRLTVANIFQLAWALLLRHYTNASDVCFGSIVSGRDIPLPHVWQMVGPFFNVVPCRMVLGDDADDAGNPRTVLDVLRENQNSIQRRNDHHHCSVPEVLRQAGLDIQGDKQLFNTVLAVQPELESSTATATGIGFKLLELDDATEYDMCLAVVLSPGRIDVELRYWSFTCSDMHASEILNRLCWAVGWIVDHPGDPITAVAF